jgi:hypothetical protein
MNGPLVGLQLMLNGVAVGAEWRKDKPCIQKHNMICLQHLVLQMVDATLKNELAMFDRGTYPTVASRELLPMTSEYQLSNIFHTDDLLANYIGGFAVQRTALVYQLPI